jgi:hypothetical protein
MLGQRQQTTYQRSPEEQAQRANLISQQKEGNEDAQEIIDAGRASKQKGMGLDALNQLLASGKVTTGPGLAAAQRDIANYFGVTVNGNDPSWAGLAQTIMSQQRGSGIMGKNMRTQKEFNTVMEGLPTLDQQPGQIKATIQNLKNLNDLAGGTYDAWNQLTPAQQQNLRKNPDALGQWQNGVMNTWRAHVQAAGGAYGENVPGNTGYSGTTPTGVKWSVTQ